MVNKLKLLEDEIGRKLTESAASGELASASGYGKPLKLDDGYAQTPEELRLGFKMLKEAGFVPPEVELMQQIAALREAAEQEPDLRQRERMHQRLQSMELKLAFAKDRLRGP